MLERKRIDIALMGTAFPNSPVYNVGVERLSIATFNVYHILHNKHAQLIPQFDQVLQRNRMVNMISCCCPLIYPTEVKNGRRAKPSDHLSTR